MCQDLRLLSPAAVCHVRVLQVALVFGEHVAGYAPVPNGFSHGH